MNAEQCTYYQLRFLECMDLGLDATSDRELQNHWAVCAHCQAESTLISQITDDLIHSGAFLREHTPEVDLLGPIMEELDDLKKGIRVLEELENPLEIDREAADVFAFVEDDLDEVASARWRHRLETHPDLEAEVASLKTLHQDLASAATRHNTTLPEVDLLDAVMSKVADLHDTTEQKDQYSDDLEQLSAFVDIDLDEAEKLRLEHSAAQNAGLRHELSVLSAIQNDLAAIGTYYVANTPEVDLVASVMHSIKGRKASSARNTVFKSRQKAFMERQSSSRSNRMLYLRWASAALLLITIGVGIYLRQSALHAPVSSPKQVAAVRTTTMNHSQPSTNGDENTFKPTVSPSIPSFTEAQNSEPSSEPNQRTRAITLQEALNTKRQALQRNADALLRMGKWASLAPEEARALLQNSGLSPEAIVGATQFLPAEEAAIVLRAAVQNNPEDPYLRYALAKNLADTPVGQEEAREQLAAWSELDPDNGLPEFMNANMLFAEGKTDDALSCLQEASSRGSANSYSLLTARYHQEALIASGMDPEVARLLAASSAGTYEAQNISEMGSQLLAYGKQYEADGDYETAAMLYRAVEDLGLQVNTGALMTAERMAGIQTALGAIDALQQVYTILQSPDGLQALSELSTSLITGLSELNSFINQYDALFNSGDTQAINTLLDLVMSTGNLNVSE